jgi:ATP-dependent Clp protease ATP-binding subunit ClpC
MLERFTERARRALAAATDEARRRGHDQVGPEHLLAGILHEGGGMGVALLDQLVARREALTAAAGRALDAIPRSDGEVRLSAELKRVLETALAIDDQHCRRHVNIEHLLSALLADEASPGFAILRAGGADLDRARRLLGTLRRMLGRASDESVSLIAASRWLVRI